jgi:hypothetical protein
MTDPTLLLQFRIYQERCFHFLGAAPKGTPGCATEKEMSEENPSLSSISIMTHYFKRTEEIEDCHG